MDSLWPKIENVTTKSPVAILKEQASLLGKQTQNLVTAEVVTHKMRNTKLDVPFSLKLSGKQSGKILEAFNTGGIPLEAFRDSFELVAPALNHYRYELFSIFYDLDFYPVIFVLDSDIADEITYDDENAERILAKSEDEFINILKAILNSEKTQRVIGAILTQSYALAEPA